MYIYRNIYICISKPILNSCEILSKTTKWSSNQEDKICCSKSPPHFLVMLKRIYFKILSYIPWRAKKYKLPKICNNYFSLFPVFIEVILLILTLIFMFYAYNATAQYPPPIMSVSPHNCPYVLFLPPLFFSPLLTITAFGLWTSSPLLIVSDFSLAIVYFASPFLKLSL